MYTDLYSQYCIRHGNPDLGYSINLWESKSKNRAVAKVIADKYLKIHEKEPLFKTGSKSKTLKKELVIQQYTEDLDFAPCIRGVWHQAKEAPHIYMRYEGGDLFKVCFIVPAFSYDKASNNEDNIERARAVLYPPKDNRLHHIFLNGVQSPNIGPFHGYNVVCTYMHYIETGIDAFCDGIEIYDSIFRDPEPMSETELIYASLLARILFVRSVYPINSQPLPWDVAEKLLKKQIGKRIDTVQAYSSRSAGAESPADKPAKMSSPMQALLARFMQIHLAASKEKNLGSRSTGSDHGSIIGSPSGSQDKPESKT